MNDQQETQQTEEPVKAKPEKLPEPTYWPFFLAMGITFIMWGLLATWIIAVAGVLICIIALVKWVRIIRNEK